MPLYSFENVKNPKRKEDFFFSMREQPRVGEIWADPDGELWKRIFTLPFAGVDTKIDHNSSHDFVEKTGKKKGSVGDLLDASKEASERRAKERGGVDPIQQRFFNDYKKKRHGVEHLTEKKKRKIDKPGYTISYD